MMGFLTIEVYRKLTQKTASIAELLAMPGMSRMSRSTRRVAGQTGPACRSALMFVLDTNVVSELHKKRGSFTLDKVRKLSSSDVFQRDCGKKIRMSEMRLPYEFSVEDRIEILCDEGSFVEMDRELSLSIRSILSIKNHIKNG